MIRKGCDCVVSEREVWRGIQMCNTLTKVFVRTTMLFLQCMHTGKKMKRKEKCRNGGKKMVRKSGNGRKKARRKGKGRN